jgi:hypothetical protein
MNRKEQQQLHAQQRSAIEAGMLGFGSTAQSQGTE